MSAPARRPTLAAERTHLAWRRTAIGLTGGGVAAAHLLQEFLGAAAWSLAPPRWSSPSPWRSSRTAGTVADGALPPGRTARRRQRARASW